MTKAIFPGSFDPLTNGHVDIIQRASKLFDEVVVAIGVNTYKSPLFTNDEKLEMIQSSLKDMSNVSVKIMPGLAADFFKQEQATHFVRGLRNTLDFESERDLADLNHNLGDTETVLFYTRPQFQNISSSKLKEVAKFGADLSEFVPANVAEKIKDKLNG